MQQVTFNIEEREFIAKMDYQPDESASTGVGDGWFITGEIVDDSGKTWETHEIDDMYNKIHETNTGFDWYSLAKFAEEIIDRRLEEDYELRISYE